MDGTLATKNSELVCEKLVRPGRHRFKESGRVTPSPCRNCFLVIFFQVLSLFQDLQVCISTDLTQMQDPDPKEFYDKCAICQRTFFFEHNFSRHKDSGECEELARKANAKPKIYKQPGSPWDK
eukprot:g12719.t1